MSKEIHLGNQAKRILEDEIFTDAVFLVNSGSSSEHEFSNSNRDKRTSLIMLLVLLTPVHAENIRSLLGI